MRGRINIVYLLIVLLLPFSLNAEKIGLLPFKPVGIESNITEAIHQLIESELSSYGHTVVPPNKIEGKYGKKVVCYNKECASEIGKQMGLEKVIFGSMTKIGEKYIISAVVVKSQSGNIVFSDKVTSKTPEDLDVCISRLAKAIESNKKVGETIEVGKVTEEEVVKGSKRKESFVSMGGGIGIERPLMGYGDANDRFFTCYIFKAWYETPKFGGETEVYLANTFGFFSNASAFSISFLYFLSTEDFSPFLVGGVGLKNISVGSEYYEYSDEANFGLCIETGAGLAAFRTYDFRFVLDGRISTSFNRISGSDGPHVALKLSLTLLHRNKEDDRGGCFGF